MNFDRRINLAELGLSLFNRFRDSTQGSIAVVTAVVLVAMTMATGMAVDYVAMIRLRANLQVAADAAAIAGAREYSLANADAAQIEAVAGNFARINLDLEAPKAGSSSSGGSAGSLSGMETVSQMTAVSENTGGGGGGGSGDGDGSIAIKTTVDPSSNSIIVNIEKAYTPFFAGLLHQGLYEINATARAQVVGTGKVCLLTLNKNEPETLDIAEDARLTAVGCGIYSNSIDPSGVQIGPGAKVEAAAICSAGGVNSYSSVATNKRPMTDCPPIPDPLIDRPTPAVGKCDYHKTVIKGGFETLSPGVYCQGVNISKDAKVLFLPGTYVIKGGAFVATDTSDIEGANVGFFMTQGSTISFTKDTTVRFTAPKDGPMAGLLIFEDPGLEGKGHVISSNNARVLTGTIYLPRGELKIDAKEPLADQSAYTAIVANSVKLKEGPDLHLNSDYNGTDIPLPTGLASSGGRVVLTD